MATIPIVDTQDKRIGIITSIIALILVFLVVWFIRYEIADPPPEDIPMKMAEPMDVTEIRDVVVEAGGGGGGNPSHTDEQQQTQTEQVLTSQHSETQVNSGQANTTNSPNSDAPPAGDNTEDYFSGGIGGGDGGGHGPGLGPDSGEGSHGTGGGGGGTRYVVSNVDISGLKYSTAETLTFKVTINSNGDITSLHVLKGKTTTTDQALINKVQNAVKRQVKYSKEKNATLVSKVYVVNIQPS